MGSNRRITGMTAGTSRALETRRSLVRACIHIIQETGSLQPEQVANRAGVSPATFYTHFANKDVALTAVVSEVADILNALAESMLSPERLLDLGLVRVIYDFVRTSRDLYSDHNSVIRLAQTRINEYEPMGDAFITRQEEGLRIFQTFVERAQKAGFVRETDTQSAAHTLMALLQSLNNRLIFTNDDYLGDLSPMVVWFLTSAEDRPAQP